MNTLQKVKILTDVYKRFDQQIVKNPLSRIRFVISTHKLTDNDETIDVKSSDEINEIISEFNSQLKLKPLDYYIEDVRLTKNSGGYLFIQLLNIEVIN